MCGAFRNDLLRILVFFEYFALFLRKECPFEIKCKSTLEINLSQILYKFDFIKLAMRIFQLT